MGFDETIAAIGTPPGEGGIGIVRISGAEAYSIGKRIFVPRRKGPADDYPRSHHLYYGHIFSEKGGIIDEVLLSFMKAPHTYTREDSVEINCHSGIFTLRQILKRVLSEGARLARPGEFTERAFLRGRIDLSQAESVLRIIRARSEEGARIAADNLKGRLSQNIREMRSAMLSLLARVEAQLDFPDDLDDEAAVGEEIKKELLRFRGELERLAEGAERGQTMQEGLLSAIVGKPNAGKSSLLNALLREQRAIVHEAPGTTRDLLEGYLTISGYPLRLIDTAGIHATEDPVEQAGIKKAAGAATRARLMILVLDGSTTWSEDDDAAAALIGPGQLVVIVINKIDLRQRLSREIVSEKFGDCPVVETAAIKDEGIGCLEETIGRLLDRSLGTAGAESPIMTSMRQARIVEETRDSLERALGVLSGQPLELVALELREAWRKLGEITGETASGELLDQIFSEFCIGK